MSSFLRKLAPLSFFAFTALALVDCIPPKVPAFGRLGYQQPEYKYEISYVDPNTQSVMTADWRLDNYYSDFQKNLVLKTDDIYEGEFEFDLDGDGKFDKTETLPVYDLRYVHLRTAGLIWLRSLPVSQYDGNKELSVFLQDYLDAVAGSGFAVVRIGRGVAVGAEKRYAPRLISSTRATVAGKEALVAIIEIANVDELMVSPNARRQQVKLVLVRSGFVHPLEHIVGTAGQGAISKTTVNFPVIMIAGYANQPEFFNQNLAEFDDLVNRIDIADAWGFKTVAQPAKPTLPVEAATNTAPENTPKVKTEEPNAEAPKPEATGSDKETPKVETPKAETPKTEPQKKVSPAVPAASPTQPTK
jgi:hypothetical protein